MAALSVTKQPPVPAPTPSQAPAVITTIAEPTPPLSSITYNDTSFNDYNYPTNVPSSALTSQPKTITPTPITSDLRDGNSFSANSFGYMPPSTQYNVYPSAPPSYEEIYDTTTNDSSNTIPMINRSNKPTPQLPTQPMAPLAPSIPNINRDTKPMDMLSRQGNLSVF